MAAYFLDISYLYITVAGNTTPRSLFVNSMDLVQQDVPEDFHSN